MDFSDIPGVFFPPKHWYGKEGKMLVSDTEEAERNRKEADTTTNDDFTQGSDKKNVTKRRSIPMEQFNDSVDWHQMKQPSQYCSHSELHCSDRSTGKQDVTSDHQDTIEWRCKNCLKLMLRSDQLLSDHISKDNHKRLNSCSAKPCPDESFKTMNRKRVVFTWRKTYQTPHCGTSEA